MLSPLCQVEKRAETSSTNLWVSMAQFCQFSSPKPSADLFTSHHFQEVPSRAAWKCAAVAPGLIKINCPAPNGALLSCRSVSIIIT